MCYNNFVSINIYFWHNFSTTKIRDKYVFSNIITTSFSEIMGDGRFKIPSGVSSSYICRRGYSYRKAFHFFNCSASSSPPLNRWNAPPQPQETTGRSFNAVLAIGIALGLVVLGGLWLGLTLLWGRSCLTPWQWPG